jgi:MOSC domain-containing protein YiiM
MAKLVSVRVGRSQAIRVEPSWMTAFFKEPVVGGIWLSELNLQGDEQADLTVHGGPDKAVCVYPLSHYPRWTQELRAVAAGPGSFGENFSVDGQDESSVCLGDIYRVGTARVQVSQPRSPCWKLARRWQVPDLPKRVMLTGRSGWYLRVLKPGEVSEGLAITLESRPWPAWSIARVNALSYGSLSAEDNREELRALATCRDLAERWRAGLTGPS